MEPGKTWVWSEKVVHEPIVEYLYTQMGLHLVRTTMLLANRYGSRGGFLAWTMLSVGSFAGLVANIAVAQPSLIGRIIAAWPISTGRRGSGLWRIVFLTGSSHRAGCWLSSSRAALGGAVGSSGRAWKESWGGVIARPSRDVIARGVVHRRTCCSRVWGYQVWVYQRL